MTANSTPDAESAWRLPRDVKPVRYELHLVPDIRTASFSGTVRIECAVESAADEIVLNAAELDIKHGAVDSGGREISVTEVATDTDKERVTIRLGEHLAAGDTIFVELKFVGTLNDQLRGFYRSKFTPLGVSSSEETDPLTNTIATTHFEPTDARRAFPCFDEPDLKATFSITVDVPAGLGTWSNWSVESEEPLESGGRRVRFGETMKMSTYLVALIVGPLEQTAAVDSLGVPITVVHVPGKANLATFALDVAKHAIEFFTEWFEIPYPADKLDMIALPDFAMGAMENLGCVTYREQALLVDPERASLAELQRVATVVNHEIAHMWFGDLVTMRWWDGIWLNEAFATLMEVHCGDAYRPEWDLWTDFGAKREAAMSIDALHATRPIEFPVGAPEEAEAMFDPLTYEKGCGVLRMLELYIGIDNFRAGIRNYLRKHSYGNTDTPDLWNALADASGEPVATIMSTWLHQGGFPLVHVADGDGSVTLTQEPFMYSSRVVKGTTSAIGLEWQIPVVTRSVGNQEGTKTLLSEIELTVDVRGGPVVVNAGGSGVFRVRYSARHLADLAARIEDLETIERFYLLSDAWASVIADRSELGDFLTLAQAIADDRDPDVWGQATGPLGFLGLAVPDSVTDDLASYVRALVAPAFGDLGWAPGPDESERVGQLRAQLLAALGTIGKDPEVRAECARAHREFLDDGVELEPQLAPAIVATVAASGGIEEYEAFLERYRHASTPQEEVRYLGALGGFKSEELAARTFELARTEIRVQDVPRLIVALLVNRVAGPPTWTRLTEHWDEITAKLPPTLTSRMAEGARVLCRDAEFADGVSEFLATHPIPSGQKSVEQTRERLGVNVAFAARLAATAGPVLVAATERLAK